MSTLGLLSTLWPRPRADGPIRTAGAATLDPDRMPRHVAIIMDGNGRWATDRGLPRVAGHRAGVEALREVIKACRELRVEILTVYAFSTENWKRPQEEVDALMRLLVEYLRREIEELHRNGVRIRAIGRVADLPHFQLQEIRRAEARTRENTGLAVNVALNYGGRFEIVDAVKEIAARVQRGEIKPADIDAGTVEGHLYTAGLPDPDLLIRTGGEVRLSNFLLWQMAYAEMWITPVYWPDFRRDHLCRAIADFQGRERRFGGVKSK